MIKARSAKAKGAKLEKQVVAALAANGIEARRQPGSGIFQDFPHDIEFKIQGERFIGEAKKRAKLPQVLEGWIGGADALFLSNNGKGPARVYMSFDMCIRMLKMANGDAEGGSGR